MFNRMVPVHYLNVETAPVITTQGGHAEHNLAEIEVACLPGNLPEFIEVELTDVELGQTLHFSDVKFPEGVSSVELAKGESHDLAVVTIKAAKGKAADAAEGEADSE